LTYDFKIDDSKDHPFDLKDVDMVELPERLRHAMRIVASAGFQLSKDAFELLSTMNEDELDNSIRVALQKANQISPKPLVITEDFFHPMTVTISEPTVSSSVATSSVPAIDIESRIEILADPAKNIASKGSLDSFVRYFRNRFEKMSAILRQRSDVRGARSIANAFEASWNEKTKFIAMIMGKRERSGKIFLEVDDLESTATVLVLGEVDKSLYEIAQKLSLDQVVCIEAVRAKNELLVAKNIYMPDMPDRKPTKASEAVNVALISDIHFGSKAFLESAFKRVILWLNGKVGSAQQVELAGRTKYVIIAGDVVDGVGIYPRQEEELAVPDIYQQYKLVAQFIQQIPEHIEVIMIPGNHDATRQSLPQPAIPSEYAQPLYESRTIISLGNPSEVRLHGVDFLLYHGTSLNDVMASIPYMELHSPENAMEYLLKCRHLVPAYGMAASIAPEDEDHLVVETPPDVFESGHIHVMGQRSYRGTLIVNSGAWQAQTDYQRKLGLEPTPGILPVVNLQTLHIRTINFLSGEEQVTS
jgi:DNA polymerase II small subunit